MASGNCCGSSVLLLDICFNLNMTQIVQKPTRITKTSEPLHGLVFISSAISSRNHTYDVAYGILDHKAVIFFSFSPILSAATIAV